MILKDKVGQYGKEHYSDVMSGYFVAYVIISGLL